MELYPEKEISNGEFNSTVNSACCSARRRRKTTETTEELSQ